ncbi:MAG: non-hydrolyzing UDP-N-acetylglucosamine 2-epimerase [Salinigranum sp.]
MKPNVSIVLGTRPEIIKLAPVIRECDRRGVTYSLVHTGQHYSEALDGDFFDLLDLPEPDHELRVGSGPHGRQTAAMIEGIEGALREDRPETVVIQGDTNSTLAGAIAGGKLDVAVAHLEAGLRSFDREMPEELNRIVADHAADWLFAPTATARNNLRSEGLPPERILVTGNTVVDAVEQNRSIAVEESDVLERLGLAPGEFGVVTVHRAETVEDASTFADVLDGVARVARERDVEMVYPIHPHSRETLEAFDVTVPDAVRLVPPQDYLDFLRLESAAALILTDSGGVQEEACILGVPCATLRDNTERPETIEAGANCLAGTDPERISAAAREMIEVPRDWRNPFGDGDAAARVLDAIAGTAPEVAP